LGAQDEIWMMNHKNLQLYLEKHGQVNVPTNDSELGRWVSAQRDSFSQKLPKMTPERVTKLNKLGFKWKIIERWREEECTPIKQNVIKHGWGNWKSMRISTKTKKINPETCRKCEERSPGIV
jgi:hypothetical protein